MLCRFGKSAGRERPRCGLLRSLRRPLAMRSAGRRPCAPPKLTAGMLTARQTLGPASTTVEDHSMTLTQHAP